ncbi:hypothetical protein GGR53DRAFT_470256 [Hypoxylon sp. FL1150]|nr:hypothetical protein GGR53DRAFT_470256 [Hypoxylon sp. FL1150]
MPSPVLEASNNVSVTNVQSQIPPQQPKAPAPRTLEPLSTTEYAPRLRALSGSNLREIIMAFCLGNPSTFGSVVRCVKDIEANNKTIVRFPQGGLSIHLQFLIIPELVKVIDLIFDIERTAFSQDLFKHLLNIMEQRKERGHCLA